MSIFVSDLLEKILSPSGPRAVTDFAIAFRDWSTTAPAHKVANPYFGRANPYLFALPGEDPFLWHVHARPEPEHAEWAKWEQDWRDREEKTSDAVVIYCSSVDQFDTLLLYWLPIGAHVTFPYSPQDDKNLAKLAKIGQAWRLQPGSPAARWKQVLGY